jgi:hypothetical protein
MKNFLDYLYSRSRHLETENKSNPEPFPNVTMSREKGSFFFPATIALSWRGRQHDDGHAPRRWRAVSNISNLVVRYCGDKDYVP